MKLYHGTFRDTLTLHKGLCLTADRSAAEEYAQGGTVYEIEIDTNNLRIVEIEFSDEELRERIDEQEWPGDRESEIAKLAETADIIIFRDVDASGRDHVTYRIITEAAIAACNA